MEARKITVVSTKTQSRKTFMSTATTLGDLKADLRQQGIDYDGMAFFEGTAKVELKDDSSVLPSNVPYKGTITNDLVFMLTNSNKKIKSGAMTRAEVYDTIRAHNLQEACVAKYGKNFTMCKTEDLVSLINENTKAPTKTKRTVTKTVTTEETTTPAHTNCVDTQAREAINRLVYLLEYYDVIYSDEKYEIKNILNGVSENEDDSYSDKEIDEMFSFVKE